jgi:hypothetical protein
MQCPSKSALCMKNRFILGPGGDLIAGAKNADIAILVEHRSRYMMLVRSRVRC